MPSDAEKLQPMTAALWSEVRDIILPLQKDEGTEKYIINRELMNEAIAYTGALVPYRLYSPEHPDVFDNLAQIYEEAQEQLPIRDKFRITNSAGSFRCQRADTSTGPILALRALPEATPSLDDLRMPRAWRSLLRDHTLLNGGLVLVVATNGQGKTTTCSATVKTRLADYGGIAYTIEDPIELPLAGWHTGAETGRCFQMPADLDDGDMPGSGYAKAMLKTLRLYPSMPAGGTILFVGEIRDPKTAAETLLAAANGHLVIATMHAQNIMTALIRLATLATATEDRMEQTAVLQMLGEVLRMVIYQKLTNARDADGKSGTWSRGQLRGNMLWVDPQRDTDLVAALREGKWAAVGAKSEAQTKIASQMEGEEASSGMGAWEKKLRDELLKAKS